MKRLITIYLELAKARLTALVVMTAGVGYVVAGDGPISWSRLFWTVFGTALAAGGANALNQVIEVERDRRMERTRGRALPEGRIRRGHALVFALLVSAAGPSLLALFVNGRTAALGLAAIVLYVAVYTPMKPRTPLCTLAGAVCGAIPPVMGWTARTDGFGAGGWILGALLFVWQIPHFLALAWLYREDYARGGFRMLPSLDAQGIVTFRMILLYCLVLLPVGLALTLTGNAGPLYAVGSLFLGGALLGLGVKLYRRKGDREARRLFFATLLYMPLILGLMMIDRGSFRGGIPVAAVAEAVSSWSTESIDPAALDEEAPPHEPFSGSSP